MSIPYSGFLNLRLQPRTLNQGGRPWLLFFLCVWQITFVIFRNKIKLKWKLVGFQNQFSSFILNSFFRHRFCGNEFLQNCFVPFNESYLPVFVFCKTWKFFFSVIENRVPKSQNIVILEIFVSFPRSANISVLECYCNLLVQWPQLFP